MAWPTCSADGSKRAATTYPPREGDSRSSTSRTLAAAVRRTFITTRPTRLSGRANRCRHPTGINVRATATAATATTAHRKNPAQRRGVVRRPQEQREEELRQRRRHRHRPPRTPRPAGRPARRGTRPAPASADVTSTVKHGPAARSHPVVEPDRLPGQAPTATPARPSATQAAPGPHHRPREQWPDEPAAAQGHGDQRNPQPERRAGSAPPAAPRPRSAPTGRSARTGRTCGPACRHTSPRPGPQATRPPADRRRRSTPRTATTTPGAPSTAEAPEQQDRRAPAGPLADPPRPRCGPVRRARR